MLTKKKNNKTYLISLKYFVLSPLLKRLHPKVLTWFHCALKYIFSFPERVISNSCTENIFLSWKNNL